jgi:hypothetical protein
MVVGPAAINFMLHRPTEKKFDGGNSMFELTHPCEINGKRCSTKLDVMGSDKFSKALNESDFDDTSIRIRYSNGFMEHFLIGSKLREQRTFVRLHRT